mgnify:CR=1 FL=1
MEKNIVATIQTIGVTEADYDTVKFTGVIQVIEKNKEKAVQSLTDKVKAFKETLNTLIDKGFVLVPNSLKSTQTVAEHQIYDRKKQEYVSEGYAGTYQVSFMSEKVELASEAYLTLLTVNSLTLNAPVFLFKNLDALHEVALKDAHFKVMDRLAKECAVLNVNKDSLKIHSWNARYDESNLAKRTSVVRSAGVGMAFASPARNTDEEDDTLNLEPGKGQINVHLGISFTYKE